MAFPALGLLAAPILELGTKLVDRIFPDKVAQAADRARAELELHSLVLSGDLEKTKIQMSAIIAEAQSPDPWTSRARPSFLYVMYVIILGAIPMGVLSVFRPDMATQIAVGMKAWLAAIPTELWTLFGVGYTGYTAMRTIDKRRKDGAPK